VGSVRGYLRQGTCCQKCLHIQTGVDAAARVVGNLEALALTSEISFCIKILNGYTLYIQFLMVLF
jgi:hypothetical protein